MAGVHVDEQSGSDATGDGTINLPFQSSIAALTHAGPQASILFRKLTTDTYEPLGTSALKKAKKTIELNEKKARKAEESKAKTEVEDAERNAREAKRIEESKAIVLTEDASLSPAIKVSYLSIAYDKEF